MSNGNVLKNKKYSSRIVSDLPTLYTNELKQWSGEQLLCGVDEAGRGCLAGPVIVAACVLHPFAHHPLIRDSKTLSSKQLVQGYDWILMNSWFAVGSATSHVIDTHNIYATTQSLMARTIAHVYTQILQPCPIIFTDAMPIDKKHLPKETTLYHPTKGESVSASIAAASIIAKVTRDSILNFIAPHFPVYSFEKHKGYGTLVHTDALKKYKESVIHRTTYLKNIKSHEQNTDTQQTLFC